MKLFIFIIILCISAFLFFSLNNSPKLSKSRIVPIRDIVENYSNNIFEHSSTKYYKSVELDSRIT
jgi:hypothetical protein